MAKVRKKYNKRKQLNRVADHLTRNLVVCYLDKLDGCVLLDYKHGHLITPTEALIAAVGMPHQWSCFIAAFGRTPRDEYFKSEQIMTDCKYYQEDLSPVFEKHHLELIERVPEHQRCGVGWIASMHNLEFTEDQAGKIFEQLGAWND